MTTLKRGDIAPLFEATDQNDKQVKLEELKGQKVVLYFYPKDDTPGCTAESCNLRDNYNLLLSKGYQVIGVSADNQKSHKKFAAKYKLPFSLLPDTEKHIVKLYGVWGMKKFLGKSYEGIHRTTFVINENGIIDEVITDVDTGNHSQQIIGK